MKKAYKEILTITANNKSIIPAIKIPFAIVLLYSLIVKFSVTVNIIGAIPIGLISANNDDIVIRKKDISMLHSCR